MSVPDIINGAFEFWGSVAVWINVYALYKDKMFKGIRIGPVVFFASWGFWNLFYYHHLHQYFSWFAGMSVTLANTVWVCQMVYYARRNRVSQ